jgi:hypothetical protein
MPVEGDAEAVDDNSAPAAPLPKLSPDRGVRSNTAAANRNTQPHSEAEKPLGREELLAIVSALNAIAGQQKASADEQNVSDSDRLKTEGEANERERVRFKMERGILTFVCATGILTLWQAWEMRATVNVMRDQTKGIVDAGDGSVVSAKVAMDSLKDTRKLAVEAKDDANRTAKHNQENFESTIKLSSAHLDATIKNSQLDHRAWIGMENMQYSPVQVGQPIRVTVSYRNTGKTPGMSSRVGFVVEMLPPYRPAPLQRMPKEGFAGSISVMQPNAKHESSIAFGSDKLNQSTLDAVKSGAVVIYAYGTLTYNDIYGQPHWSRFCSFFQPANSHWPLCEIHNDFGDGLPPST